MFVVQIVLFTKWNFERSLEEISEREQRSGSVGQTSMKKMEKSLPSDEQTQAIEMSETSLSIRLNKFGFPWINIDGRVQQFASFFMNRTKLKVNSTNKNKIRNFSS